MIFKNRTASRQLVRAYDVFANAVRAGSYPADGPHNSDCRGLRPVRVRSPLVGHTTADQAGFLFGIIPNGRSK
jgi:hypothetical protein